MSIWQRFLLATAGIVLGAVSMYLYRHAPIDSAWLFIGAAGAVAGHSFTALAFFYPSVR